MPAVVITDLSGKHPAVPMVGKGTPVKAVRNHTATAQQGALNATGQQAGARFHVII
ncbi:MAG: hypothetical protein HQK87_04755 [Nitrospinae bacterium]|nr:hypothetical protein [Nitrospinota bacterium]